MRMKENEVIVLGPRIAGVNHGSLTVCRHTGFGICSFSQGVLDGRERHIISSVSFAPQNHHLTFYHVSKPE